MSKSSPSRRAINQHLHQHHGGAALSGDTLARNVQHDLMHDPGQGAKENDVLGAAGGIAGEPAHFHRFSVYENEYLTPIEPPE